MKTEVIMKRTLFGSEISQKSKSEFFSATDLLRAGNKYRVMNGIDVVTLKNYWNNTANVEFMNELELQYGKIRTDGRGKGTHTWVHPLLFIDIALWLNPKLKVEVYRWLQDHLLQFRNDSGSSYNRMTGALYKVAKNKSKFPQSIQMVARYIRLECGVKNWETATESQLKLRDRMHDYISFACDMVKDANTAVEVGIKKAKELK